MAKNLKLRFFAVLLLLLPTTLFAQKFGFQKVLNEAPEQPTVFCIPNNDKNLALLNLEEIHIKFQTNNWLFITTTPLWINESKKSGALDDFYFEYAPPVALADTARMYHNVDQVHAGAAPLNISYTGKDVIVGVVDQGIDWLHPDFIDTDGNTRVLRYWDHSVSGPNPPAGFGYGQEWDSTSINNGTCTSTEQSSAHGSTVAGMAVGNGRANGTNMGMATEANIVIVETNFNLPNWTLTIADAIDYIFEIADEYNMPAVVNLSLGSYLGSHDGNDPAAEMIETLLDEKPGRIVVSAAGNSGKDGKYHNQHTVTTDTSFVWFENNPTAAIAPNTIFFDLWSDQADAVFDFALGANAPGPGYSFRGRTNFYNAASLAVSPTLDTIWNNGNRIATVEIYNEVVNGNFHMQFFVSNVDSTDYLYRFETTGSGKYDLWSGAWIGYNDMVETLPTIGQMPDIVNYVMPDSMQTIVSSWNCSEKVISVANMKNRHSFIDNNGNTYVSSSTNPVESRSPRSSLGPNRHGLTKPNITAAGDNSLTAAPLWLLTNPIYNQAIDSGGWHAFNGGTSMASPVVAGIAALYFERCGMATYQGFMDDLYATAYTDQYTGTVPNNAYGNGKADAFAVLQELTLELQPTINYNAGSLESSTANEYQWYIDGVPATGQTNQSIGYEGNGSYQVLAINTDGCTALSNPYQVTAALHAIGITEFKVFPNPSSNKIEILSDVQILKITCFDMHGNEINLPVNKKVMDVSSISSGNYVLQITTTKGSAMAKFVKL